MMSVRELERLCAATLAGRFGVCVFLTGYETRTVTAPIAAAVANSPDVSPERAVARRGPEQGKL